MAGEVEKVVLRYNCQICGAWQEASNALVGVLDSPYAAMPVVAPARIISATLTAPISVFPSP